MAARLRPVRGRPRPCPGQDVAVDTKPRLGGALSSLVHWSNLERQVEGLQRAGLHERAERSGKRPLDWRPGRVSPGASREVCKQIDSFPIIRSPFLCGMAGPIQRNVYQ